MSIRELPICFNTSDNKLEDEFYNTCLKWATTYDRGVGYFSSPWIARNAKGLTVFVSRGGIGRWIVSPIIDEKDYKVFVSANNSIDIAKYFDELLSKNLNQLVSEMEENALNALAWMIYDKLLEFRFAIPTNILSNGDFHDKFGIFYGPNGETLSFNGSINDSAHGFSNYESIKIFRNWDGTEPYVKYDISRFGILWTNSDENVRVYIMSDAIKSKIFKLRKSDRPYKISPEKIEKNIWAHQDTAVERFMFHKNGILEMATGTGKTRTALRIISQLFDWGLIDRTIVIAYGNDLLYQWEKEIRRAKNKDIQLFKCFHNSNEMSTFLLARQKSIFLVTRDAEKLLNMVESLFKRNSNNINRTLIIFDEVHGLGSFELRKALSGKIKQFKYRLGLSATPVREYDEEGNNFIENEIGPIIFKFSLEDAIKKGVLCEFDYKVLTYELTKQEKIKKRNIIAYYAQQRKQNKTVSKEDEYRALSKVNKTSISKIPLFDNFAQNHPDILDRCIIFVEDRNYGKLVQDVLIKISPEYHTYYSEDDRNNLRYFAEGKLKCLLTCKKISEGVDIKSVKNIIIFASDRSSLVTTQRIGRSLRIDPDDPSKRAFVLDFVSEELPSGFETNSDIDRSKWLVNLAKIRRE